MLKFTDSMLINLGYNQNKQGLTNLEKFPLPLLY